MSSKRAVVVVVVVVVGLAGCGPEPRESGDIVDAGGVPDVPDARPACAPLTPAGPDVQLAAPYDALYRVYDLGVVPGVPNPLGGTVISASDPDTLLVAGGSENASGAIYAIGVIRDHCGHITGFTGTATLVANTPYVDANLLYMSNELMLYTEWPRYTLSQLATSSAMPDRQTDLRVLGMPDTGDSGPGGLGRVPAGFANAGDLRLVTWPGGRWYHVVTEPDGSLLSITGLSEKTTLPNQPGGFAYVPAGSPGFPEQSVIVAEWRSDSTLDRVAVYDVDGQGDPLVATRREFFARFPRPWGAYFEPVTGDYLFLSWGTGEDRVYVVQGFVPPPPIF